MNVFLELKQRQQWPLPQIALEETLGQDLAATVRQLISGLVEEHMIEITIPLMAFFSLLPAQLDYFRMQ